MDAFPKPGESRKGISFTTCPGGKGANQAVALSRLGADVRMAGMVGRDAFGDMYLKHLKENGVNCENVAVSDALSTGTATIEVNDHGENHIIVVLGANEGCNIEWLDGVLEATKDADIYLLQLEIALDVAFEAARKLHAMGKTVILDPAPAVPLPADVIAAADYITPNETELRIITADLPEDADTETRVKHLLAQGAGCVVHKAGSHGAYITTAQGVTHVPSFKVKAVDTTAAGDTFNAGLAMGLSQGMSLAESVRLAHAAAGLSVTKLGAQGGMPTMAQVQEFLAEQA